MVEHDGPITGSELRHLIERCAAPRAKYVIPPAAALEPLAASICVLRGRCRSGNMATWSPQEVTSDDLRRRASQALATLAEVLPEMRAEWLAKFETDTGEPAPMRTMLLQQTREIEAFERTVHEAWDRTWMIPAQELSVMVNASMGDHSPAWLAPAPAQDQEISKWHHFAVWLAGRFRDVMQAANPTAPRFGISKDGPVVRFLVAVIPLISGEADATPHAVRKWLQRQNGGDKAAS